MEKPAFLDIYLNGQYLVFRLFPYNSEEQTGDVDLCKETIENYLFNSSAAADARFLFIKGDPEDGDTNFQRKLTSLGSLAFLGKLENLYLNHHRLTVLPDLPQESIKSLDVYNNEMTSLSLRKYPTLRFANMMKNPLEYNSCDFCEGIDTIHFSIPHSLVRSDNKMYELWMNMFQFPLRNLPASLRILHFILDCDSFTFPSKHCTFAEEDLDELRRLFALYHRIRFLLALMKCRRRLRAFAFKVVEKVAQRKYHPMILQEMLDRCEKEATDDPHAALMDAVEKW